MRIVLDLQGAQGNSRFRGIGRYAMSLAKAIIRRDKGHEIFVALSDLSPHTIEPIRGTLDSLLPQDHIRVWQAAGPVRAKDPANFWRRAAASEVREGFIAGLRPDVVHVSDMFGGFVDDVVAPILDRRSPYFTTISLYDLIPLLNPDEYLSVDQQYEQHYRAAVAQAKHADGWFAISESSAREAIGLLEVEPSSVFNISAACDDTFEKRIVTRSVEANLRQRFGLRGHFVMYSGGADARKNLRRLIQAFAQTTTDVRRTHQLVMVGRFTPTETASLRSVATESGMAQDDIAFTGYVQDEDLILLYNLCDLFILPSIHEGFGLPALEAMACGAAVIGGNLTSLPEVIGWSNAMFDPLNVHEISAKIERALLDRSFRSELARRGAQQVRQFSWAECAERAIGAFERLRAQKGEHPSVAAVSPELEADRVVSNVRRLPGRPSDSDLVLTARSISSNHPLDERPRLLVDASTLMGIDLRSGIQRVVRSMLAYLPDELPRTWRMEVVYATAEQPGYRLAQRGNTRAGALALEPTPSLVSPGPGDVFLGLDLSHDVINAQTSFYAELRRLGIPVQFVVYDLLPLLMPDRFPPWAESRFENWLTVVAKSDAALCISRAVADELYAWVASKQTVRYRPLHIGWFHLGADLERSSPTVGVPPNAAELLRAFAARPTFLHVGTLEPRKGHAQTIDAFDWLWLDGADINLVFVGKHGWHVDELAKRLRAHRESGVRFFWLESTSDEFLSEIYKAATCLILPSEGEGFGLPLIEAARHGLPIIARDIPVFREVAGPHAAYFDGVDAGALGRAVRVWLDGWRQGHHPRSTDIGVLTWQQSAAQLVEALLGRRRYLTVPPPTQT